MGLGTLIIKRLERKYGAVTFPMAINSLLQKQKEDPIEDSKFQQRSLSNSRGKNLSYFFLNQSYLCGLILRLDQQSQWAFWLSTENLIHCCPRKPTNTRKKRFPYNLKLRFFFNFIFVVILLNGNGKESIYFGHSGAYIILRISWWFKERTW